MARKKYSRYNDMYGSYYRTRDEQVKAHQGKTKTTAKGDWGSSRVVRVIKEIDLETGVITDEEDTAQLLRDQRDDREADILDSIQHS